MIECTIIYSSISLFPRDLPYVTSGHSRDQPRRAKNCYYEERCSPSFPGSLHLSSSLLRSLSPFLTFLLDRSSPSASSPSPSVLFDLHFFPRHFPPPTECPYYLYQFLFTNLMFLPFLFMLFRLLLPLCFFFISLFRLSLEFFYCQLSSHFQLK